MGPWLRVEHELHAAQSDGDEKEVLTAVGGKTQIVRGVEAK